jgi:histidine kinase
MIKVPGFQITNTLLVDNQKMVCRAVRKNDNKKVILKIYQNENNDPGSLFTLQREYDLLTTLELNYVPKILDLIEFNEGMAIVMEDNEEVFLKKFISQKNVSIPQFLDFAINATKVLFELHSKGIVHKDINSENILIDPTLLNVKIIGFGIAIQILQETVGIVNHNKLEGSLGYISPEQTGRMNCPLDYRSDFYSLGITFYETVTGVLPFESDDPLEILHGHLAKVPVSPSVVRNDIPLMLTAIIMKLVSKSPENRYQSVRGLKYDLEKCQTEFNLNGSIEPFILGSKDYTERFKIPQRLYGRDKEIDLLLNSFDSINENSKALVLVSGFSGIGKSTLIQEIHKPIIEKRGFYISGKFDQFQRDIPYIAINQALRSLIRQILAEKENVINEWKTKILTALGLNIRVVSEVIPDLELIVGVAPKIVDLPPSEAQNRFNLVFLQFIQCLSSKEHPLVLFLDDLQWADTPSLNLLELLLTDNQTTHLLVIGVYRDNEVLSSHPLVKTIQNIKEKNVKVDEIKLETLQFEHLNQLVSDTLLTSLENTTALSNLILKKTYGNPFFVNEFLKNLHFEKLVVFNAENESWEWEIEKIESQEITDNVVVLMSKKLKLLDSNAQQLCRLGACIGNRFDLVTLSTVYEKSIKETAKDLLPAILAGLVIPIGNNYRLVEISNSDELNSQIEYRFSHDRVQQAAYSTIEDLEKKSVHLKIGRLLLNSYSSEQQNENIFDLLFQFNKASSIILDSNERIFLAKMNLAAGKKAKNSAAYEPAFSFLKAAEEYLPENAWNSNYDLTLEILSQQAESAYLIGDFDLMETQFDIILKNSKDVLHTTKAYIIKIQAYTTSLKIEKALEVSLEALRKLGIKLDKMPNKLGVISGLLKTKFLLRNKTPEILEDLPIMTSELQKAQMLILSSATSPAYFFSPNLFPLIIFKQVQISVKYGNSPDSSYAYSTYGLILSGVTNDFIEGQKFGDLALKLMKKYDLEIFRAKIQFIYAQFISHWTKSYKSLNHYTAAGFQNGMESGDFLFGGYNAFGNINMSFYAGMPLPQLLKMAENNYLPILQKLNQSLARKWVMIRYQSIYNFSNSEVLSLELKGISQDEQSLIKECEQEKEFSGLATFYLDKMILHYFMGNIVTALENGNKAELLLEAILSTPQVSQVIFYQTMCQIRLLESKNWYENFVQNFKIKKNINKIKIFADANPANQLARFYLVNAELDRINKKNPTKLYLKAIEAANKYEILHDEALAYELLGRYYEQINDLDNALKSLLNAKRVYLKWGANAKVNLLDIELESRYFTNGDQSGIGNINRFAKTSQSSNVQLDLVSMIKSSVAISSEIVFDKLLSKLMLVVIENAGAQNGYILLQSKNTWHIMAGGSNIGDKSDTYDIPLLDNELLPESVVNYVIRTKENLVIFDIQKESLFSMDPMVIKLGLNSVLCFPILNQNILIGVLYLENSLNSGVFDEKRVEFLKLISGQIAVSLQNALIYQNLEQKVLERTLEIQNEKQKVETALIQLKVTQAQVIQSEKMASLGELTAGIAHEIQNPLNFVNNFSELSVDLANELMEEAEKEEFDKDLIIQLVKDISQNQEKITHHGKRASSIVKGMLEHSRISSGVKVLTDINALADEYLRLAFHGLRGKDKTFNASMKTNFDENIGKVNIVTQDFGRVILNLITNAFYAVNEKSKEGIDGYKPIVEVSTHKENNNVLIKIIDNGNGIPQKILDKIFQPFFTTKPTGQGTGLGLSLAYDIVKGHNGELLVKTKEGEGSEFTILLPIA